MKPSGQVSQGGAGASDRLPGVRRFGVGFGLLLAIALVKLGNPVVLDRMVARPSTPAEWWLSPWPMIYGWVLLLVALVWGGA